MTPLDKLSLEIAAKWSDSKKLGYTAEEELLGQCFAYTARETLRLLEDMGYVVEKRRYVERLQMLAWAGMGGYALSILILIAVGIFSSEIVEAVCWTCHG